AKRFCVGLCVRTKVRVYALGLGSVVERLNEGVMIVAIKTVGVVGAGQMGSGIAHVCALAGFDVLLHDAAADRLEKGIATINGNMARQVASGKLMEDQRAAAMKLIRPANSMEDLAGVDL